MTASAPPFQDPKMLNLEQGDFKRIAAIARSGWGLNLDEAKRPLIKSRLSKRLRALGLKTFKEYCDVVETGNLEEVDHFIEALTTNVTHFYREVHHFQYLEASVLPTLLKRAKSGERVRIWSAGCSSGKEPYSIAASILALDPAATSYDLKILATDIDQNVLQTAEQGKYDEAECSVPDREYHQRIFDPTQNDSTKLSIRSDLKKLITFRVLNLMTDWPMTGKFDVIMCRNVAIYFDRATQESLWKRLIGFLQPDGTLMIGHSERIADPEALGISLSHTTTYQMNPAPQT